MSKKIRTLVATSILSLSLIVTPCLTARPAAPAPKKAPAVEREKASRPGNPFMKFAAKVVRTLDDLPIPPRP